jgi:AAA ATPase domain
LRSGLSCSVLEVLLAGRHKEFGALVSEYHATRMGQTRVAVVLGEVGIGKTRLVSEFLHWARAREADVLEGAAAEGGGLPYRPLIEAIRPRIERERAPDDLPWLSELCRLLPELKERYPDLPPPSGERETAKGTLFEAIARSPIRRALVSPGALREAKKGEDRGDEYCWFASGGWPGAGLARGTVRRRPLHHQRYLGRAPWYHAEVHSGLYSRT